MSSDSRQLSLISLRACVQYVEHSDAICWISYDRSASVVLHMVPYFILKK